MLEAYEITHLHEGDKYLDVMLTFDERQKSRYKTQTQCGQALGWFLERGRVLSGDDVLRCEDGTLIKIECAPETVSDINSEDVLSLTKAAYHLGNRHVSLQVEQGYLRYQQDYVLDDMVRGLGLVVTHTKAPFHPESGAYSSGQSHSHGDSHGHSHGNSHSHDHSDVSGHDHSHSHEAHTGLSSSTHTSGRN